MAQYRPENARFPQIQGGSMASIDPRTWTDKRGRQRTHYRVQIRRVGFPTVTKTFKRRTDARAWARNTEADIERGLHFPNHEAEKRTLAGLVERQLEHVKLHRPDDYERQDATLNWWKGKLGDYTLAAITIKPDLLAEARDELTKEGLSPATVNRYMAALSAGFTNAVKEWRWMRENPMRN